jgi:hypothetical protein
MCNLCAILVRILNWGFHIPDPIIEMAIKEENIKAFLEIINVIIPSLNGQKPDSDSGTEKPTKNKHFGPNLMIKHRYLILLYVARLEKLFQDLGELESNIYYFSARSLEKIANHQRFYESFKFDRPRAMRDHYFNYERDGLVIHIQKEVPRGKDANSTVKTDLVTLSKEGEKLCESIIDTLLASVPEEKRPKQKLTDLIVPTHDEKECHNYGLSWLRTDYFELHKSTGTDFENWKKGFDLPSIKAKKELRREGLIADIKNKLESQGKLVIVGQPRTSKTTILMELMCDYFDAGYEVLYNYGTTEIRNVDGLVNFVEEILSLDKKILVAIDNVHKKETYSIFYFVDKLSYSLSGRKLKIIMTARKPEFDRLLNRLDNAEEKIMKSIRKVCAEPNLIFPPPYFTKEEVKELVECYSDIVDDEKIVDEITEEIYSYTKGDPVKVKFSILDRRLEQDVAEISGHYLKSPLERKTVLICSILEISHTEITDTLLEKCGILETAHNLSGSVLYRNSDDSWKTKGHRWILKLFSFFFNNKPETELEERKQDLRDSIVALYHTREERVIYSVIKTLYFIEDHNLVSVDMVESVFRETKSEIISGAPKISGDLIISSLFVENAKNIADAYYSLKKDIEGHDGLHKLVAHSKLEKAIHCYDSGDYEGAMKYCDEASEEDPSSAAADLKREAMARIYDSNDDSIAK